MALIDKASLLMVPSTYEAGTLYNVLPSGNRAPDETGSHSGYDQTRADFTFDRGTNAAATRVNADGLIEKYRENLLLQSNQFDTTWATNQSNITSGQIGYDGSSDAWKLAENSSSGFHSVYQIGLTTGVSALSVYAKTAGRDLQLRVNGIGLGKAFVNYDLSAGTIGSSGGSSLIDFSIESVGNGWYRCSFALSDSGTYGVDILTITDASTSTELQSYIGDNTSGVLIQNAQLETGLVATDYLDSGATTAKAGVLVDLPRINYDANGENGALLLEPSRQQLVQYSEYFGGWTNDTNTSLTPNAIQSPSGFVDAYKLIAGTSVARQGIKFSLTPSGDVVQSVFAKKGEYSVIQITDGRNPNLYANFDLENGVLGSYEDCTPIIEPLENDWYRCVITYNSTLDINVSRISIAESTTQARLVDFAGNGIDGIYIWGAQVEAGSYATSYIPNHGTSGGVTRAADSLFVESLADELTTGYTEATLMIDFKYKQNAVGDAFVWGQDNNTYPAGRGYLYSKQSGFADSFGGGGFSDMAEDTTLKLIYRLNSLSNADVFLNGTKGTNVSGTAWTGINQIRFRGAYYTFEINQIAMFSEALTDAECITLTTL